MKSRLTGKKIWYRLMNDSGTSTAWKLFLAALLSLSALSLQAAPPLSSSLASGPTGIGGQGVSSQRDFLPVEQAYQLTVLADPERLVLQWRIADGYYLYRHGFKALIDDRDVSAELVIPAGITKHDELFGEVEVYYATATLELPLTSEAPLELDLQSQGCADAGLCYPPHNQRFRVDSASGTVTEIAANPAASETPLASTGPASGPGLPLAALFAFIGGLALNLMPCVLPVLSLKVLGLTAAGHTRRQRIGHGWWYTAGVLASFVAIAALLLALKLGGAAVGWGFQLQSPWFVGALVYLFFLMAMLLVGAADFSGSWMGFGQSLASGGGYHGSFFTGALAVLVASPCTAPLMGSAMGFALTQPPATAVLVFVCLGAGMAAPFLLLSHLPSLGRWLPSPGPWMVRFREFLAFPLLATGIWLLWVIGQQAGAGAVALVLTGCLVIALALWLNGATRAVQAARAALFIGAGALLASTQLTPAGSDDLAQNRYSPTRVADLRAAGRAVFVNFTADWCITCMANEHWVLAKDDVRRAFADHDVTYLIADWTNKDAEIAATLERFGRVGIPLYLFYPAGGQAPVVLPQLLSVDLVLATVRRGSTAEAAETAKL